MYGTNMIDHHSNLFNAENSYGFGQKRKIIYLIVMDPNYLWVYWTEEELWKTGFCITCQSWMIKICKNMKAFSSI